MKTSLLKTSLLVKDENGKVQDRSAPTVEGSSVTAKVR